MSIACVPFLQVADVRRSLAFYCDVLGFDEEWQFRLEPGLPATAAIRRAGVRLFLTEHHECAVGALVYCYVDDVDLLYGQIVARGARPLGPPSQTPWRTREFEVHDPDGNKLRFGRAD